MDRAWDGRPDAGLVQTMKERVSVKTLHFRTRPVFELMQKMSSNSLTSPLLSLLSPSQSPSKPALELQSNSKTFKPSPLSNPPSISHCNSLIRTHIESRRPEQALSLFHRLLLSDPPLLPDNFTFPLLLKACSQLSALKEAQQIHCLILKAHFIPAHDVFIHTSLINAYAECGNIDNARLVFERMPERNTVTWNSMMAGFLKCGDVTSAVRCFNEMPVRNIASWNLLLGGYVKVNMSREALMLFLVLRFSGLNPDESTMVSLVSAVSDLGLLDLGRIAHGYIARSEFSLNGALGVGLITMYGRCGSIDAAYKVFLAIQVKNVGHWTSMIGSLANHGLSESSLRVFDEMLQYGIRPNYITFIGVLNACRHAGLAEEGLKYFKLMKSFNVEPRIEHYGCLVDLLGRSGLVEEAMEIACNLPADPGFVVWGMLLAACRNHGNVEIAEIVAKKLIELNPEHGSPYVLLSNLYAKVGRWDDFRRTRKTMAERRVVKVPGFSWIEVNGRVHEFVAGDRFHVKAREIYGILEEMKENLRWAGCESVPFSGSSSNTGTIEEEEDFGIEYPIA